MMLYPTIRSLSNMICEMNHKQLEIKRITKTASLLILSGVTPNSIPQNIIQRVLKEQHAEGGWISIVDTMWNAYFLELIDNKKYFKFINNAKKFLINNKNRDGLWGRSKRDISRIPVTGIMLYLFPDLNSNNEIYKLEKLWESEINSLVYKAGYTLMAFKVNNYIPTNKNIIEITCEWLMDNQRNDGGFAPWLNHPIDSDVFCTSIATLGLLQYHNENFVSKEILKKSYSWLLKNRLKSGVWKYHEIEDGASWGVFTLSQLNKIGIF